MCSAPGLLVNKRPEPHWAGDTGPTSPSLMASVSCSDVRALAGDSSDSTGTPRTDPGVAGMAAPHPPGLAPQARLYLSSDWLSVCQDVL